MNDFSKTIAQKICKVVEANQLAYPGAGIRREQLIYQVATELNCAQSSVELVLGRIAEEKQIQTGGTRVSRTYYALGAPAPKALYVRKPKPKQQAEKIKKIVTPKIRCRTGIEQFVHQQTGGNTK